MRHFLDEMAREHGLNPPVLTEGAMKAILGYPWPGNVRQLRSMCERWVIQSNGGRLDLDQIPAEMRQPPAPAAVRSSTDASSTGLPTVDADRPLKDNLNELVERVERDYFEAVLARCDGHLGNTATHAGITRRTLYTKMRQYGLDQRDFRARSR